MTAGVLLELKSLNGRQVKLKAARFMAKAIAVNVPAGFHTLVFDFDDDDSTAKNFEIKINFESDGYYYANYKKYREENSIITITMLPFRLANTVLAIGTLTVFPALTGSCTASYQKGLWDKDREKVPGDCWSPGRAWNAYNCKKMLVLPDYETEAKRQLEQENNIKKKEAEKLADNKAKEEEGFAAKSAKERAVKIFELYDTKPLGNTKAVREYAGKKVYFNEVPSEVNFSEGAAEIYHLLIRYGDKSSINPLNSRHTYSFYCIWSWSGKNLAREAAIERLYKDGFMTNPTKPLRLMATIDEISTGTNREIRLGNCELEGIGFP